MLLNKAHVKKYILQRAKEMRPGWDCKQVSACVFDQLDRKIKSIVDGSIHRHPSIGKTFKEIY